MKLVVLSILVVTQLVGCYEYRNSPKDQVEDAKICRDGDLGYFLTPVGEIKCKPKL